MKFSTNSIGSPDILKRKCGGELLVPITVTAFTDGVCKAGTPLNANGAKAATSGTSDAVGILYADVYEENPNGSLIEAYATVNTAVGEAHSGVTYTASIKAALPLIKFA